MRRIFVVGCPRSGTTLLQSFLAAHPQVHSFPETHFFHRLQAPRRGRRATGLAATGTAGRLDEVAGRLGAPRRPVLPTVRRSGAAFVAMADAAARRNGADTWVEKTPANLYVLDLIERVVPGAQVVHIVRDGVDVVASLCAVAGGWGTTYTVDTAIDQWAECIALTDRYRDRSRHSVVGYDSLVRDPEAALAALCVELGLPYTGEMVTGRAAAAGGLVEDFEHWKAENTGPLRDGAGRRAREVFDAATLR
ncbi:Sulfotransferase family protein [Blastococcus sp. DSM 46786]|uniref:sulfotransferase family protein n=1 Tax=Blastococcus sp. DSM 46786 TaxID=1798227 RepID=UPI0008BB39AB|nr:sulfotransferase [Blastococcus sp. DSM 46786]SEK57565.1 Sulfotransferase family protein [Blastococcus sp. DSM 46786]